MEYIFYFILISSCKHNRMSSTKNIVRSLSPENWSSELPKCSVCVEDWWKWKKFLWMLVKVKDAEYM